jgi:hypothetical protein
MPRIRSSLLVAVVATVLLGAGCSTSVPGTATSGEAAGPSGGDLVAWTDGVCGALLPVIETGSTPPQLDRSATPQALVQSLSDYLQQAEDAAGEAIAGLDGIGPSPARGGDRVVTELTSALTTFRDTFADARTQLDALDTSDPEALRSGLPAAIAPLEQLSTLPDPTADLQSTPEFEQASREAPNCQQIESLLPE